MGWGSVYTWHFRQAYNDSYLCTAVLGLIVTPNIFVRPSVVSVPHIYLVHYSVLANAFNTSFTT